MSNFTIYRVTQALDLFDNHKVIRWQVLLTEPNTIAVQWNTCDNENCGYCYKVKVKNESKCPKCGITEWRTVNSGDHILIQQGLLDKLAIECKQCGHIKTTKERTWF